MVTRLDAVSFGKVMELVVEVLETTALPVPV
jgi:hypothetical protein